MMGCFISDDERLVAIRRQLAAARIDWRRYAPVGSPARRFDVSTDPRERLLAWDSAWHHNLTGVTIECPVDDEEGII